VWPDHVDGSSQARVGEHRVEVETLLELRADEPVVRVTTSFVNPSRDHRLRVHLPLPEPARTSRAESAFTVVERGLTAEGRSDEFGLPTAPAHRFVSAGGLTVVHDGVCEYELIDITPSGGRRRGTIALTVLRATGMLSRLGMAYRPFPAGPLTPVDGLQMTGRPSRCATRWPWGTTTPTHWPTTSSSPSSSSPRWAAGRALLRGARSASRGPR
jgi:mannosylglycerate hydrolase